MAPRKGFANLDVTEEFRIRTEKLLRNFIENGDEESLQFPHTLNNHERAWIHNHCRSVGLGSRSSGKEPRRYITVTKKLGRHSSGCDVPLYITQENYKAMQDFISHYPLSKDKKEALNVKHKMYVDNNMGQITYGTMQVPSSSFNKDLIDFRINLPIWPLREQLMEMIIQHQVLIVCGETGSGKTTQLPQFILDYASSCSESCRIVCTQPRRISAVSVAERVAEERGEKVGQTVGFHIRLESSVGPQTVLIYCTNGILLRALMNGDVCLKTITHIIVDEIHERDRFCDFLLICLRECLVHHPHVRLILMSATMDISLFQKYFNNAPVYFIPGRVHPVQEYFLDEILQMINYESPAMINKKKILDKGAKPKTNKPIVKVNEEIITTTGNSDLDIETNECIEECFETGSEDSFSLFLQLILSENVPVNYQHPETGYTALMASSYHGNYDIVQQLLTYGATPSLVSTENYKAIDYAYSRNQINVIQLLQQASQQTPVQINTEDDSAKQLTDLYTSTVSNDVPIDFDLLHAVLYSIHTGYNDFGSILVFLPGYDDIVICRDRIQSDNRFNSRSFVTFMLHGSMPMSEQHKVFNTIKNKRKIILSTNIAETSITIDDVIYVVDCGKVKEVSYDAIVGITSLQSTWISRAAAKQRAGRAGRVCPGTCFHLYTKSRWASLNEQAVAEMLRMPLAELCLQTKLLAPRDMGVSAFLARAPEPPPAAAPRAALAHLTDIEALDTKEQLTPLGAHLVDMPVPPRLAKMLIYAVVLKCIDPVLTLVSTLAHSRWASLSEQAVAEMLRMPLAGLCLQTKLLAPRDMGVCAFLARAPEPPPAAAPRAALAHLTDIEALDTQEQLTPLGAHLVDMPVPPRLAKMLIYAVVLKCIDPVLTLVSTLAHRDPFLLPKFSAQKASAEQMRRSLAAGTFSDHVILLRVFQLWQEAGAGGRGSGGGPWCSRHHVSAAVLEMVVDIRNQLLAHLRAAGFVRTRPPCDIRDLNHNAACWPVVKAVLAIGLYPNIACVDKHQMMIRTK